ncbi:MAG: putative membrane protein [Saprospiraceae bacterium]|jgi:putative membrane protein
MRDMLFQFLPLFKALHIVGAVGWFGGLFYLVRIFVYHKEAMSLKGLERDILIKQYRIMEDRVYRIICTYGMNITWIFGILMIAANGIEWFAASGWLHIKLLLVVLLSGYQHYCKRIIRNLAEDTATLSSFGFRLLNEVPSVMLLMIVLLAVYRNSIDYPKAILGIAIFGLLIYLIALRYKTIRERSN